MCGLIFTGFTVTSTVALAVSVPSLRVYSKLASLLKLLSGVNKRFPFASICTVPFAELLTPVIVSSSPSISLSLLNKSPLRIV